MNKEELQIKHSEATWAFNHTYISIEYAISILEDYREEIIQYMIGNTDKDGAFVTAENAREIWSKTKWDLGLEAKIQELKALIK